MPLAVNLLLPVGNASPLGSIVIPDLDETQQLWAGSQAFRQLAGNLLTLG